MMPAALEGARAYYERRARQERQSAEQASNEHSREVHQTIAARYEIFAELDLAPPLQLVTC